MKTTFTTSFKRFTSTVNAIVHHFFLIHGSLKAAALAYATLVSVVPLMVLSLGFILAFPAFAEYFQTIHQFLFRHFVPSSADVIRQHVQAFAINATNLSAISLLFFLFTAVLLIFSMETAFNAVWNVKTRRRGIFAFLIYWAVLTLIPPIAGVAFAISVSLYSLPYVSVIMKVVGIFIPLLLTWTSFLILYMTVPNCKVKFRHAAAGAGISAILFETLKLVFRFYFTSYSSDAVIYGVLALIPGFLVWLYVTWLIIIFGAVIAFVLGQKRESP